MYRRGSRWANLAGALAIAGAVAAVAIGLPALDRAVPAVRPVAENARFLVGAGVTVVPPPGASVDVSATRPGSDQGAALFILGSVRYAVVVTAAGSPGAPVTLTGAEMRLRNKITRLHGYQVTSGASPINTAQGTVGRQGSYASPGRTGWYAVFVGPWGVAEVTASGTDSDLRGAIEPIQASVRDLHFPAEAR